MADESLGGQSAIAEARGLYRLLSTGSTVEQIRMLISVPPKIEAVLLAYAGLRRGRRPGRLLDLGRLEVSTRGTLRI